MISDVPGTLVELLFVRDVWELPVADDLPVADPPPDRAGSTRPRRPEVVAEWEALWADALNHLDSVRDEHFWGRRHGLDGINLAAMRAWKTTITRQIEAVAAEYHHAPETLLHAELDAAAGRGLNALIILPVRGPFARSNGPRLLVSTLTYLTVDELRHEVATFGG